jgi:hypothetical protein
MCRTTTMPTRAAITVVVLLATLLSPPASFALAARSDLSGQWALQLDPSDAGMKEKWFAAALPAALPIELPGSLQSQGFGNDIAIDTAWTGSIVDRSWFTAPQFEKYRQPGQIKAPFWLQPDKHYVGAAWYQRSVQLPTAWNGRRLVLHLERPHWETRVWIDDREAGICNALGTPHQIDLTHALAAAGGGAGRPHRLTIRVDNAVKVAVGVNAHSVTDHTQSNWNGIVGAIELRATDRVWIDDLQVYPDLAGKCVTVRGRIGTHTGSAGSGTLTLSAERVTSPATLSNGSVRAPRLTPLSILGPGFCCTWPFAPRTSAFSRSEKPRICQSCSIKTPHGVTPRSDRRKMRPPDDQEVPARRDRDGACRGKEAAWSVEATAGGAARPARTARPATDRLRPP